MAEQRLRRKVTVTLPICDSSQHCASVDALRISPDGRHLFSASRDSTIKRWVLSPGEGDAEEEESRHPRHESGEFGMEMDALSPRTPRNVADDESAAGPRFEASFEGHSDWVNDCCVLEDLLVSCSSDCTVRCWKADAAPTAAGTVACLHTLTGHSDFVQCLAAAPAAAAVVSAGCLGEVFVWNLGGDMRGVAIGGGSAAAQGGQRHSTYAVDCTANANTVATGSTAGGVRVWDARSGQMTHDLQLHTGNVRAIQISADGQMLLSGGADRTVRLWDLGQHRCVGTYVMHAESVWGMHADEHLSEVISWDRGGCVFRTEVASGDHALLVRERGAVHALAVQSPSPSPDCELSLWTSSVGSDIRRWDVPAPGTHPARRPESASRSPFARSSPLLAGHSRARGESVRAPAAVARPSLEIRGVPPLTRFRVLPDKRHVLTQDLTGSLSLWDVALGQPVRAFETGTPFDAQYRELFEPLMVASWFLADTKLGCLSLTLDPATCFSAEVYALDVGLSHHAEETKLNFGGQVVAGAFDAWAMRAGHASVVRQRHRFLYGHDSPLVPAIARALMGESASDGVSTWGASDGASGGYRPRPSDGNHGGAVNESEADAGPVQSNDARAGSAGGGVDAGVAGGSAGAGAGESGWLHRRPVFAYGVGRSAVVASEDERGRPWRAVCRDVGVGDPGGAQIPDWVRSWVLKEEMPQGLMERYRAQNDSKITFYLTPEPRCGLPELPQPMLVAPKILQVRKAATYVQQRLGEAGRVCRVRDPAEGGVGEGREGVVELLAVGRAVPWSLTLVALKHYVFKGSDVQLTFRPLGPDGPAPVLTIEPPAKDG